MQRNRVDWNKNSRFLKYLNDNNIELEEQQLQGNAVLRSMMALSKLATLGPRKIQDSMEDDLSPEELDLFRLMYTRLLSLN